MIFFDFGDKNFIKHFGSLSRRADLSPTTLSEIHKKLGFYLGQNIAEYITLEEIEIQHPQGLKLAQKFKEDNIVLLSFMRAGMYVAEGLREIFNYARIEFVNPIKKLGLTEQELNKLVDNLNNKHIIIADSVVNTGSTLFPVIEQLMNYNILSIHIATLVMPIKTADYIKESYKNNNKLYVHTARISNNSYVGKGKTDTGNRLFGSY